MPDQNRSSSKEIKELISQPKNKILKHEKPEFKERIITPWK